jgi:hypothetical protein
MTRPNKPKVAKETHKKQPTLTQSQYDAKMREEAERLIAEKKMPPPDKILQVMQEARAERRQKLLEMRRKKPDAI